jgi:hypothetical protein
VPLLSPRLPTRVLSASAWVIVGVLNFTWLADLVRPGPAPAPAPGSQGPRPPVAGAVWTRGMQRDGPVAPLMDGLERPGGIAWAQGVGVLKRWQAGGRGQWGIVEMS